jgi:hypothetical protein
MCCGSSSALGTPGAYLRPGPTESGCGMAELRQWPGKEELRSDRRCFTFERRLPEGGAALRNRRSKELCWRSGELEQR